ncbi:MAG: hypothetical protein K5882_10570 [Bacteroidales bacterium]|nr:hypothetical protein [Bacteroidales bacterium]
MNTITEKPLDYRCFLLGIILYWMFDAVWVSFASFFFALEAVLHPIAIVVGKSLLFLLVFYLLFRKPRMIDVKWGHLAMLIGFILLMTALNYFLLDRFFDLHSVADNQMKWDIPNYTMQNVRKWANLVTSFLTVGFLWWRYDSENTDADETVSSGESRSYYGGILFAITLGYILSLIRVLGGGYWQFAHLPILDEIITCLLIILITIGAILMLVKRHTMVLSITMIFILIVIHFFSSHYLPNILSQHLTPNDTLYGQGNYFASVPTVCDIAFNLAAFILYRREMKQQNV